MADKLGCDEKRSRVCSDVTSWRKSTKTSEEGGGAGEELEKQQHQTELEREALKLQHRQEVEELEEQRIQMDSDIKTQGRAATLQKTADDSLRTEMCNILLEERAQHKERQEWLRFLLGNMSPWRGRRNPARRGGRGQRPAGGVGKQLHEVKRKICARKVRGRLLTPNVALSRPLSTTRGQHTAVRVYSGF
ncbi:hypothetical protein INR49_020852 [Caranx melampygus]|nr:hypothetical protein INR49_020852 [Caranx melampygus]